MEGKGESIEFAISTHILTKRMTDFEQRSVSGMSYFNSHPHEEDDYLNRFRFLRFIHFNSHPHEEDDGGMYSLRSLMLFQLTSSRRG